jgi:hypothetical protein
MKLRINVLWLVPLPSGCYVPRQATTIRLADVPGRCSGLTVPIVIWYSSAMVAISSNVFARLEKRERIVSIALVFVPKSYSVRRATMRC